MFNIQGRRRVHFSQRGNRLDVHIDRQNYRWPYFWFMILSTVAFGEFCEVIGRAAVEHPPDGLFVTFPVFALGMMCYILVFAICGWAAFGTAEICVQAGTLVWTRKALSWTSVRDIPFEDITEIKAITSWHRFRNSVEIMAAQKRLRIGDNLLRDEALELAQHLRRASGLRK